MALQIWLPLDKNLNNQGLSNISINNTGTTIDNNGKIGKCFKITAAKSLGYTPNFNNKGLSLCGWFKFNKSEINAITSTQTYDSTYNSCTGNLIGNNSYGGIGLIWQTNNIYNDGSLTSINIKAILRTSTAGSKSTSNFNIEFNKWIHIALTLDPNTHILSLYKDGVLFNSVSNIVAFTDGVSRVLSISYQAVWGGSARTPAIPIYENDIRVYDHCLSTKEVHEISKGLVLHYKLDANGNGNIGNVNLVKNGWGGTENWSNGNYSTTELPAVSGITHSYYNCNTIEFIPIISNHSYVLSAYIKSKTGTGTCYVSLIPYDIDKNQITYEKTAYGFRASSLTTLSEDLKSGDTIVHLTNASGWANPSTHQYVIAIFGYTDSTGYTYPDLVYTRRIYAYGTTSDKSHLNIANNTVTLNAAYNGPTIAKGTSVCLTGYGSSYYYPITESAANASNWVLKSTTIIPKNVDYLKAAKYVRVISISGYQYLAGITLTDNSASNIIYDCSGYKNHGTITGTLNINNDSPRYNYSLVFNGSSFIKSKDLNLNETSNFTISSWINITASQSYQPIFWLGNGTTSQGISIHGPTSNRIEGGNGTNNFNNTLSTISLNSWTHIVITYDGTTIKRYINGVLNGTISFSYLFGNTFVRMYIGYFWGSKFKGNISDFRLYLTTLSADDVKELYDTPTFIDNQNNLLSGEFDEHLNNMLDIENSGINSKQWLRGLNKYTQANCQCTLEDDGYRVYRPANLTQADNGNTMWGGFLLRNYNNQFGLQKGHTYIIEFDVKGQSSNAASWSLSFNMGNGPSSTGLLPSPSNVVIVNPVVANFNSSIYKHCSYKFTINDEVYKTCVTTAAGFTSRNTYVSYRDFKFGYVYSSTGELGTDIYIKNLRMYDITSNIEILINKNSIIDSGTFIEEENEETRFFIDKIIKSVQLLEI